MRANKVIPSGHVSFKAQLRIASVGLPGSFQMLVCKVSYAADKDGFETLLVERTAYPGADLSSRCSKYARYRLRAKGRKLLQGQLAASALVEAQGAPQEPSA